LKQFPVRPALDKILPSKSAPTPSPPVDKKVEESNERAKIEIVEEEEESTQ